MDKVFNKESKIVTSIITTPTQENIGKVKTMFLIQRLQKLIEVIFVELTREEYARLC